MTKDGPRDGDKSLEGGAAGAFPPVDRLFRKRRRLRHALLAVAVSAVPASLALIKMRSTGGPNALGEPDGRAPSGGGK